MSAPSASQVHLRAAQAEDAAAIAAVYAPYVRDTVVSFEEVAPEAGEMASRLAEIRAAGLPWLLAEQDGVLLGYAYATRWRARPAYRHAVESSVYLADAARGRGIGSLLYSALLCELRVQGKHTVIGGIALPNPASEALHRKLGFRQVAHFEQTGFKFGRWIDTSYWQLLL